MGLTAYFSLGLLSCLVVGPFMSSVQAADCPNHWLSFSGHCYGYFHQELSWQQAEGQCQRNGGHLASILSRDEHKAIARFLQGVQKWDDEDVWIGLYIPASGDGWAWADGSPVAYTAWEKVQSYFTLKGGHCAALDESSGFRLWDGDECHDRNPFLCKV
ncbi:dromaiocalcin-1-like [Rhineura floridana]|uniref:dromaiocalcin-1-like n=1 Tax=Rhineura floridana TaxID=261503 RepID=UPI002AC8681D|nr:dromaiocalcin-1-like [Rhineura floridana]